MPCYWQLSLEHCQLASSLLNPEVLIIKPFQGCFAQQGICSNSRVCNCCTTDQWQWSSSTQQAHQLLQPWQFCFCRCFSFSFFWNRDILYMCILSTHMKQKKAKGQCLGYLERSRRQTKKLVNCIQAIEMRTCSGLLASHSVPPMPWPMSFCQSSRTLHLGHFRQFM